MSGSLSDRALEHLALALTEVEALREPDEVTALVEALELPQAPSSQAIEAAASAAITISRALANLSANADAAAYVDLLPGVRSMMSALPGLAGAEADGARVFEYLVTRYIERELPLLGAALELLGVMVRPEGARSWRLDFSRLGLLLTNPSRWASEAHGWPDDPDIPKLLSIIGDVARFFGFGTAVHNLPAPVSAWLTGNPDETAVETRIPLVQLGELGANFAEVGVAVAPARARGGGPAMLISAYAVGDVTQVLHRGELYELAFEANMPMAEGLAVLLEPGERPTLMLAPGRESDASAFGELALSLRQREEEEERLLLSLPPLQIGIRNANLSAGLRGDPLAPETFVALQLDQIFIALRPDDPLSSRVIPQNAEIRFGVVAGWSSEKGLHFGASVALDVTLNLHLKLGPVTIEQVRLTAQHADREIELEARTSFSVALPAVSASVTGLGVGTGLSFPQGRNPEFSDLRLLFPSGGALVVNAGAVTGGGFIDYNQGARRYAGGLQLAFGEIGLAAFGVIAGLPNRPGYSILMVVGVEFNPAIQLPYNFSISGFGGMLGIHRRMDFEALRAGLQSGLLDVLLFPRDLVAAANRIAGGEIDAALPMAEGRVFVGPMVKLGWGGGKILQAELAIVIELPPPIRVALLGQVTILLPPAEETVIELHIDVLGFLDAAKRLFSLDFALRQSYLLQYPLRGEGALRLRWGDNALFAMSLGGFHPRFDAPSGFPNLKRLSLDLGSGSLDLVCSAYHALTSNSLQFGARLDAYVESGGASLEGRLSFDSMIRFSPFEFDVEIDGRVVAAYRGKDLAGVRLSLGLSGPTPWRARGRAKFEIWKWDVEVDFDKSWGSSRKPPQPQIDVWNLLLLELQKKESWGSATATPPIEALKPRPIADGAALLLHPAGMLEIRQRVAPFGVDIERFGGATVTGRRRFELVEVRISGTGPAPLKYRLDGAPEARPLQTLKEPFARGQYENLSKDRTLSLPAFDSLVAGAAPDDAACAAIGASREVPVEYEVSLIGNDGVGTQAPVAGEADWTLVRGSAAARAALRNRGVKRFNVRGAAAAVKTRDAGWLVVDAKTLAAVVFGPNLPKNDGTLSRMQADQALAAYAKANARSLDSLLVVGAWEAAA